MGRSSTTAPHLPVILALADQGKTTAQIASQFGVAQGLIATALRLNGRKAKRGPHYRAISIDRCALQDQLDSGLTQSQIAIALGASVNTIERRVRQWGLRTARTGPRLAAGHTNSWAGGRHLEKHGYILIYAPLHPYARAQTGCVAEHRLLMEVVLGRYLDPKEVVHHLDDHPYHNSPENLGLFATNADHLRHELTGRIQSSPRTSIPGAYRCSQTIDHCPDEHETLGQCTSEIRAKLAHHIAIHRPTIEQQVLAFRDIRRSGANLAPFRYGSTE